MRGVFTLSGNGVGGLGFERWPTYADLSGVRGNGLTQRVQGISDSTIMSHPRSQHVTTTRQGVWRHMGTTPLSATLRACMRLPRHATTIELLRRALCAPQPLAHLAPFTTTKLRRGAHGGTRGVIRTLLKHRGWSIVKQLPVERCRKGHGRGFR